MENAFQIGMRAPSQVRLSKFYFPLVAMAEKGARRHFYNTGLNIVYHHTAEVL